VEEQFQFFDDEKPSSIEVDEWPSNNNEVGMEEQNFSDELPSTENETAYSEVDKQQPSDNEQPSVEQNFDDEGSFNNDEEFVGMEEQHYSNELPSVENENASSEMEEQQTDDNQPPVENEEDHGVAAEHHDVPDEAPPVMNDEHPPVEYGDDHGAAVGHHDLPDEILPVANAKPLDDDSHEEVGALDEESIDEATHCGLMWVLLLMPNVGLAIILKKNRKEKRLEEGSNPGCHLG
jgi:hypothetical protein